MIDLPDIPSLSMDWKKCLPNIIKFLERRNLTFQNIIQEGIYLFQNNETGIPFFMIFIFHEKMGIEHLKIFLALAEETIVRKIIIIYQNTITTNCSKVIENLFQYEIDLFKLENFFYDITHMHYYVPHLKITCEKEYKNLFEKYGNHLPILLKSDSIVKYYGFKRNDIIKVVRSPQEFVYRIVR